MAPSYALIVSQGRVADRTDGALVGARRVGDAVSALLEIEPHVVGTPTPAWSMTGPSRFPKRRRL